MRYVSAKGRKTKAIKVFGSLGSVNYFKLFEDFYGTIDNPKAIDTCISSNPFAILFRNVW